MNQYIKKTVYAISIAAMAATQASAFCAYNKSSNPQTWYFMENERKAKQFLEAILVSNIAGPSVEVVGSAALVAAATAATASTAGAAAPTIGVSAAATAAAIAAAKKEAPGIFKSLSELLKTGLPKEGDLIVGPTGVISGALSDAGTKVSMGVLNVRWGKNIAPGTKACWNKNELVFKKPGFLGIGGKGVSFIKSNKQPVFFLVIGRNKDDSTYISYSSMVGVDKGITASN